MANGLMIVESRPNSSEQVAEFHDWYDTVHIPEILEVEGFVSARRLASLDGASFIAVYEIEGDVDAAKAHLEAALASGDMSRPVGVELDPPPTIDYFRTFK
jgi:hypothetical protein